MEEPHNDVKALEEEIARLRKRVNRLETAAENYHTLFENAPLGIFQTTPSGRCLMVNPAFAQMAGFSSPAEMLASVQDITSLYVDPGEREELVRHFAAHGEVNGFTIRFRRQDGRVKHLSIFGKAIYNDTGEISYYDGFTLDITAEKEALDEKRILTRAIDHAVTGVVQLTLDGTITYINQTAACMLGYDLQETPLVGHNISQAILQLDETETILNRLTEHGSWRGDLMLRRRDGSLFDCQLSINLIKNAAANPIRIVAFLTDITAQKETESLQKRLTERIEAGLQAGNIAWWEMEFPSGKTIADALKAEMLGYQPDQFSNYMDFTSLIHPDDYPKTMQAMRDHINGLSDRYEVEYRILASDGRYHWFRDIGEIRERDDDTGFKRLVGIVEAIDTHKQAELERNELFNQLQSAIDTAQLGVWTYTFHDKQATWNDIQLQIYGLTREQFNADPDIWLTLIHPQDKRRVLRMLAKAMRGETIRNVEFRIIQPNGTICYMQSSVTPVWENGKVEKLVGVNLDVSPARKAADALADSEARHRAVINALNEGLVVQNQEGAIIMCNQSAATILGLTMEQLLGKDSADPRWQAFKEDGSPMPAEEHPAMITLRTRQPVTDTVMNVHVGDGRRRIISINSRPFHDGSGSISGAVTTFMDITARTAAEAAQKEMALQLEQQAHRLQLVMDSVPEGVLVIDAHGTILLANPPARQALQLLNDDQPTNNRRLTSLGEKPIEQFLSPPHDLWHQLSYHGHTFEIIAESLKDAHSAEGWVVIIRDVTHERQIQQKIQQQERLAAVGQLAAGIAHDFNNIMAVINLYTDLSLRDPRLPPEIQKRLDTILSQTGRASDLIQQILDFGRRSVMERLPLDLLPLVKELVKLFQRTLPENIDIDLHYSSDIFKVNADPTRLQQVLMNLAFNARDAMPAGGTLQIQLDRLNASEMRQEPTSEELLQLSRSDHRDWVRLTLKDTGCGIPSETVRHIFEPFFTTKERGKGSGLGLAQVFGIIKQHEGDIQVSSTVGEGTAFHIYLPALTPPEKPLPLTFKEKLPAGQQQTILIVEDDPIIRQVLEESLTALNYNPMSALDGRDALDILQNDAPDVQLILCDLVMPRMGGKALLQEMEKRQLHIPVVIITGHPLESEKEEIMRLGATAWLNKPPQLSQLASIIQQLIR